MTTKLNDNKPQWKHDAVTNRRIPLNLSAEPPYPGAEHVVCFSIAHPDMATHLPHPDCDGKESGHLISECGMFQGGLTG